MRSDLFYSSLLLSLFGSRRKDRQGIQPLPGWKIVWFDKFNGTGIPPFQDPMYLIVNLALGGSWGGEIRDDEFPRKLIIDYVRIYEKDPQSTLNVK